MTPDELRALASAESEETRGVLEALSRIDRQHERQQGRLYALFEEAPIFLTLVEGSELRVAMVNRRARAAPSGTLALGKSVRELVPADNPLLTTLERVFATGVAETIEEHPSYFPAGAHPGRYFTRHFVPLRDEYGNVDRILVATNEVTTADQRRAMKALEIQTRDLEAARREAVDASRAKDEFLAILGHELRNPLAPMFTTIELMRLRGSASREIDVLERQVRHLARLVAVGIAPDMIDKVFDAFAQRPQKSAHSQGGLGLGLSIVKSLVEAHGGTVAAESEGPDQGSAFVIELPAITAPMRRPIRLLHRPPFSRAGCPCASSSSTTTAMPRPR